MPELSDAEAIAREAQGIRAQVRRQMRALLDPHAVATRLFRGPDGQLKDDAAIWLADLGHACFADRSTYDPDARQHLLNEGARITYFAILKGLRLDHQRLAALKHQLKEADDE